MSKNSSFSCLWPFSWAIAHYFGVPGQFAWPIGPNTPLRDFTKNSWFVCLRAFFMSYFPLFGVLCRFAGPVRPGTCLRDMTKTRRYYLLWPFSWDIAHNYGVLGGFALTVRLDICLIVMTKNSLFSCFMVVFMSYFPQFWGSVVICMALKSWYVIERFVQKLIIFCVFGPFSWAISHYFGVPG